LGCKQIISTVKGVINVTTLVFIGGV